MKILYQIPTWIQNLYAGFTWRRDSVNKTIYLTFDDGPIPEVTPAVLEMLRRYGVKATFFVVGDNAQHHPELMQDILADGHRLGNHTFHHLKGHKTHTEAYLRDVQDCQQMIDSQSDGTSTKKLFRPPHGRLKSAQKQALLDLGYEIIMWDVLTHDYNPHYSPEKMMRIIRRCTRSGSIITFHDSLRSNQRMLKTLPLAIEYWQQEGFHLALL